MLSPRFRGLMQAQFTNLFREAIIITVMVLEMKAPHGRDLIALRTLTSSRLRRLMCGSVSDLPRGFRF
jgi:hypothetical protein